MNFLIAPSQRTTGIIHTAQSRRATGPPNPSADYIRRTKGGRYRSSGGAYVSLKMAPVEFDSPAAASGNVTRYDGPGVVSSGGMGGLCSSVLGGGGGGGDRIQVVPATESSLLRLFGAPLAFATFSPRAMRDPHASRDDSVGAPIMAATFLLLTYPSLLHRFLVVPCVTQTPPLTAPLAHPSLLQRLVRA